VVHVVLAGITLSQMCHTTLTKLNLVNLVKLSPIHSRAFSIYNTRVKDSSLNLGVLIDTRGGNRYQGSLLILTSPNQVKLGLNEVVAMLPLGCHKCCHYF
jgi:hypothetical protein